MDASADGTISGTLTTESGAKYSGGKAQPIEKSDLDLSADISGNFNIECGFGVTGSVVIAKVIRLQLTGEAGVELGGTAEIIHADAQKEEKHLCPICIDGDADLYFKIDFKPKVGLSKKYSATIFDFKPVNAKIKFAEFYISVAGGDNLVEFGWGKCPHKAYLVTAVATDQFGNRLTDATITIRNDNSVEAIAIGKTETDGTFKTYCENGNYRVSALSLDGYQNASEVIDVNGKATTVMLQMKKGTSGTMTCDVYDLAEYQGKKVGTATMKILSDKEAVFSMKFTVDNFVWNGTVPLSCYNDYHIAFGGNLENNETPLFSTGYTTFHPWDDDSPEEYTSNGIHYLPNYYGNGCYGNYYFDPFLCSDLKEDLINQEASWKITVSNTVDFSFYDLEGETMSAEASFISM